MIFSLWWKQQFEQYTCIMLNWRQHCCSQCLLLDKDNNSNNTHSVGSIGDNIVGCVITGVAVIWVDSCGLLCLGCVFICGSFVCLFDFIHCLLRCDWLCLFLYWNCCDYCLAIDCCLCSLIRIIIWIELIAAVWVQIQQHKRMCQRMMQFFNPPSQTYTQPLALTITR